MELFKSRTRVVYTNAVGDKVYPVVVDIKKGIKSTEDIQFVSSDVNTGILSVAFIQGNDNYNVTGADVVCSVMRPDASTLDLPCEVVRENIVEVPLGINGTSQDGVYSFDFKVFKGENKVVGTPIMNYSVSLSISNDMVVEEDDRLPVLTVLMTQLTELKDEAREVINQANTATVASREATANAIEATNNANAVSERVSQETATAISEIKQDTENAIDSMNQSTSSAISTMNQNTTDAIADMTQKTDEAVTRVNDNLTNINNTVATKVAELDTAKSDMTTTVSNKVNEVETRFNTLTSTQQQDAEVIDARDGETSLKARLDRDIEKAKQVYVNVEGSNISTDSSVGYLKDVEILGNTIQDASNLADIRSVGDKVEGQELYEIPVLSRGKNLAKPCKLLKYTLQEPHMKEDRRYATEELIPVKTDTSYMFSTKNSTTTKYVLWFDSSKNFISRSGVGSSNKIFKVQSPSNAKYCQLYVYDGSNTLNRETEMLTNEWQLEEGTVATEYEPYQEDKLTILSPTPLEKVGDVRDRIIEKDGVWGVEKNIKTVRLGSESAWSMRTNKSGITLFATSNYLSNGISNRVILCDALTVNNGVNQDVIDGYNQILAHKHSGYSEYIYISKDFKNTPLFTAWLDENPINIKYVTETEPVFIPLPHDQQVKLRTFTNKTNISFLTEVEGTIKAQVPKSLGATVNTHTEQINNLNKELDRVKKLEESTVSTVTTESDFTTVEATSNGYFEDVKLEGKTLVNLVKGGDVEKSIGVSGGTLSKYNYLTPLKNNTLYTVILNIDAPDEDLTKLSISLNGGSFGHVNKCINGISCFTLTTNETPHNEIWVYFTVGSTIVGTPKLSNVVVLEGDHTQNPPSYFEGLKSVGQDVDEIVVLSRKEDGNLFDGTLEVGSLNASGDTSWRPYAKTGLIRVKPSSEVICKIGKYKGENATSTDIRMAEYDMNKKFIKFSGGTYKATVSDKTHYVKFAKKLETSDANRVDISAVSDVVVVYGNELHDIPHQSDKKRLLFYNEESQTWEKPILREWDSIEKHSNGKYYYHQRSGEVVLNGSEEWGEFPKPFENTIAFQLHMPLVKHTTDVGIVADKIQGVSHLKVNNEDVEGISLWDSQSFIRFRINKSKLSTQDVQGFKQWLQANNVTVVYQLAQEKVYECTNIDLITYEGETNYIVESGVITPKSILKVHNNISNVVKILQEKVSLLESNVKASQEVQDMMILETDMRMLDIELALMEFAPMKLNLGGSDMLRSATYFNFLKNHIVNETYEKGYLENVMNKYLATGRINQDEYDELYNMLYPPVYDIELPIEP